MTQETTSETTVVDPLDRIDNSIDIDASAERVWQLVSRPGWWINTGVIDPEPELRQDGDTTVLIHPELGEFRLLTVESDEPSHISFRWMHRLPDDGKERSTLVEFWIEARGEGVRLRVAESGFSGLQKPREEWLEDRADNVKGWESELAAARTSVEGP